VLAVGLTGGIGSGKSTVADLLAARGAVLIDADRIAREVVEPGRPAHGQLVERFGSEILAPDGTLDRKAVAALAFADEESLEALNSITHPAIGIEMLEQLEAEKDSDHVVILDIPLLKPVHRETMSLDLVVVVDCPVEVATRRLVELRGFDPADASARIAAQITREQRMEGADVVIDNSHGLDSLQVEVDELWRRLTALEQEKRSQ
jgi:dephospho-CoA kinase